MLAYLAVPVKFLFSLSIQNEIHYKSSQNNFNYYKSFIEDIGNSIIQRNINWTSFVLLLSKVNQILQPQHVE
jgi:hypothetical protein